MVVDFHTHIFSKKVIQNRTAYLDDLTFNFLYSNVKARMIDHSEMLKAMEESGIDFIAAMGFPWEKEKYCEEQNTYFRDVIELSGGKIIPFGSIPLSKKTDVAARAREIRDMGLGGIGEIAFYKNEMNKENTMFLRRLLESAGEYSLPVCLHVNEPVGHSYPGKYNSDIRSLYPVLLDYPDTVIILAHWGGGLLFYELMPEINKAFSNIYYDTAASPFLYKDQIYDIAVQIIGPDRILFGSDYPLIKFGRYLSSIENSALKKEDRDKITGGNAAKILKIIKE